MKKKIIGIFVCMLLIATFAIPISALNKENIQNIKPIFKSADVPVWVNGDSWTYEFEIIVRSDPEETQSSILSGDIVFTVTDDEDVHYTLTGVGESISFVGNLGPLGIRSSRIFTLNIDMEVRKNDLAINSYMHMNKGIMFFMLGPIIIPFPIQGQFYRNSYFTPDRPVLPFPLHDGKNGTFSGVTIDEEGATKLFWGLITLDTVAVSWPSQSRHYTCTAEEITVPAGTFDVYNVSTTERGNYIGLYYNATVGNTVKMYTSMDHGVWHDWWQRQTFELKSTTYTP